MELVLTVRRHRLAFGLGIAHSPDSTGSTTILDLGLLTLMVERFRIPSPRGWFSREPTPPLALGRWNVGCYTITAERFAPLS